MSLINEALKRARQVQQDAPAPVPPQHFRPVESAAKKSRWDLVIVCAVILLISAGGGFVWMAIQKHNAVPVHATPATPPATQQAVAGAKTPSTSPALAPAAAPVLTVKKETLVTDTKKPVANVAPVDPSHDTNKLPDAASKSTPVQQSPLPKLRGIYFNPSRPSAVLNTKTVFLGDTVGGYRVAAITASTVTLEAAGQTSVLSLGE